MSIYEACIKENKELDYEKTRACAHVSTVRADVTKSGHWTFFFLGEEGQAADRHPGHHHGAGAEARHVVLPLAGHRR